LRNASHIGWIFNLFDRFILFFNRDGHRRLHRRTIQYAKEPCASHGQQNLGSPHQEVFPSKSLALGCGRTHRGHVDTERERENTAIRDKMFVEKEALDTMKDIADWLTPLGAIDFII
jgi:hypothetical protein